MSASRLTRRRFIQHSSAMAAAAIAPALHAEEKKPSSEKLNLAVIGLAHRAAENLKGVASENIVAICDVDTNNAALARSQLPNAAFFTDFRKLYDAMEKRIDAVVVATPDHTHFHAAYFAVRAGKHVYCEKPLCHTVREVRTLRDAAAKQKIVTQMGTQIHAEDNYRRVVELVRSGAIGTINKVHVWITGRDLSCKIKGPTSVPEGFDWDLWLGPLPPRPFQEVAHPNRQYRWPDFDWRWWWEFGGGLLADMACHYMDLPYWALELPPPAKVRASGKKTYEGDNDVPDKLKVEYEHPAHNGKPAVQLTWYHGVTGPDLEGQVTIPGFKNGVLFEGDKGQLVADYSKHKLLPEERFKDFQPPPKSIPSSIGHHREWIEAVKGNGTTTCPFSYSGALTEAVLLGNVSYRAGEELIWDAAKAQITNTAKAAALMGIEYRKGWEI
jgi:predicted dehydrogenase